MGLRTCGPINQDWLCPTGFHWPSIIQRKIGQAGEGEKLLSLPTLFSIDFSRLAFTKPLSE